MWLSTVSVLVSNAKNGVETFALTFVFVKSSSGFADDSGVRAFCACPSHHSHCPAKLLISAMLENCGGEGGVIY